jgi:hypothetical protein
MRSIKEKAEEYGYTNWQSDEYHDGASEGLEFDPIGHTQKTFEAGANYVLEEIENFMKDLNLGNSAEEKFYKLDVFVDIYGLIELLRK